MKKRLGKGLSALIDDIDDSMNFDEKDQNYLIPTEKIKITNIQARKNFNNETLKELAESIKKHGIVQPILVRKSKNKDNYELIAGERRFRAAKIIKLNKISSIVIDIDDKKAFEIGLIENLQREDLSPIEEGEGYKRLMEEFNYTQEQLASIISKSRSHIANLLRITTLPDEIKKFILNGSLTLGHARPLVGYINAISLAKRIVKEGLTVRYVEKLCESDKENNFNLKIKTTEKDADTSLLEKELSLKLGMKLLINDKNNKGNIKIEYKNADQREKIINILKGD